MDMRPGLEDGLRKTLRTLEQSPNEPTLAHNHLLILRYNGYVTPDLKSVTPKGRAFLTAQ
jgi:hypothetical protein